MYTHLNLLFVLLFRWLPESVRDVVRASTLLILVVVCSIWLSGDLVQTYGEFADSFGASSQPCMLRIGLIAMGDILLHVVPISVIGLPRTRRSYALAFGILASWYATNRHQIHAIYVPSIQSRKADRGVLIAGLVAFRVFDKFLITPIVCVIGKISHILKKPCTCAN